MTAIIVIAASEGGLEPLRRIVSALPQDCNAAVFIVWHIGSRQSILPSILNAGSAFHASFAVDGGVVRKGRIYVAPPDHHLRLSKGATWLDAGPKVHRTRPAADPLFFSAATEYGAAVTGIVLSGGDGDGAAGLAAIKAHGGAAFVQTPEEAIRPGMPLSAMMTDHPDAALPADEIARLVRRRAVEAGQGSLMLPKVPLG